MIRKFCSMVALVSFFLARQSTVSAEVPVEIDATTLKHKVLCGYQGWFRCPGDPANVGWRHWSRNARKISLETLTVEMWPDMTEYGDDEKYAVPGFTYPDGKPAHLFSSANPKTVGAPFPLDAAIRHRRRVSPTLSRGFARWVGGPGSWQRPKIGQGNGPGVCPLLRLDRSAERQGL